MMFTVYHISSLLLSLHITAASAHPLASITDTEERRLVPYLTSPQRPITLSPPSQHPILSTSPSPDHDFTIRDTLKVPSCVFGQTIPATFTLSSQICPPLIPELPYIVSEITQQLLVEHFDGLAFPASADSQPASIYLGANITEQIHTSKFVLNLSLKLSPLKDDVKEIKTTRWRSVIGVLEQGALALDKEARKRNGVGWGSIQSLEVEIEDISVFVEWRSWRIVDGEALICEARS